jgi:chromosome segregation ATPase
MASPLLLNGQIDTRDQEIEQLRAQLQQAFEDLRQERMRTTSIEAGVRELNHVITPLYRVLQKIKGEIDEILPSEEAPQSSARWNSWKQRMPGRPAEFIDLLLVHKSMTIKQFMAAAHCGQDAAYKTVSKLGQAGITVSAGGRYSLKEP